MSDRWDIEVGRVVVRGAPPGRFDEQELRALVGSAIGERLRAADLPPVRRSSAAVRIEAGRVPAGTPSLADSVASAVVGAVTGGGGSSRG
jgi:hypothetical protein